MLMTLVSLILLYLIFENIGFIMQLVVSIIVLQMFLSAIYYLARQVKRWNKGRSSVFTTVKNSITNTVKNCYKATMRFFFKKKIIVEMLPV